MGGGCWVKMDQHPPVEKRAKEERGAVEAGREGGRMSSRVVHLRRDVQSINQIRFYYQPTTTARLRGGGGTGAQNIRVEYVLRCCLIMKASQLTRSQFPKSTYVTLQC